MTGCKQQTPQYLIGFSQCSSSSWHAYQEKEIERELLLFDEISLETLYANEDSEQQIKDIQHLIDQNVDVLIVSPNEEIPELKAAIERAYDAGIPVILLDRKVATDKYTAYIGADNIGIGNLASRYIMARLDKNEGTIVEIQGMQNSSTSQERHQGFADGLRPYPQMQLISIAGEWNEKKAAEAISSVLEKESIIDAVFVHNDLMTPKVYQAMKAKFPESKAIFVGVDALPGEGNGVDLVLNHMLDASFICPTNGNKAIQTAVKILKNESFERDFVAETALVDRTIAVMMKAQYEKIESLGEEIQLMGDKVQDHISQISYRNIILIYSWFAAVLIAVILVIIAILFRNKRIQNRVLLEKNAELQKEYEHSLGLTQKLEEATNAKLSFFTNISHDIRTPLILIVGPVRKMVEDTSLSDENKRLLRLMFRNVRALLRLADQILDFRNIENGIVKLNPTVIDVKKFLQKRSEVFKEASKNREINFFFKDDLPEGFQIVADKIKFESIYYNLMQNALKFTPKKGTITTHLYEIHKEGKSFIEFYINNKGTVIPKEEHQHLFERFYSGDAHAEGYGIGLTIVKSFVEAHKGTVRVESNSDSGTTFYVTLPTHSSIQKTELPTQTVDMGVLADLPAPNLSAVEYVEKSDVENPEKQILIIDDNQDTLSYLRLILEQEFCIFTAQNATEGISIAGKIMPDLIICDIMMPGDIDGLECCKRLKSDLYTSHIPIILLTAKAFDDTRVESYENGANSFIAKPFDERVLLSRIRNLLEENSKPNDIQQIINAAAKPDISELDKDFLTSFMETIQEQMGNPELTVESIGQSLGFSRVQLYRKVKALTNQSPNEVLRIARLKRAAYLLRHSKGNISEVAYKVGFNSPSYFSKCYRDYFGETPKDSFKL